MNTTTLIRKPALTVLAALLASPFVLLARPLEAASGADDLPAIAVSFGDLDVSRPEGLETLYKRLKGAANTICAQFDSRELARRRLFDACVDHALAGAIVQTRLPTLAALYTEKTGHKLAANPMLTAHR